MEVASAATSWWEGVTATGAWDGRERKETEKERKGGKGGKREREKKKRLCKRDSTCNKILSLRGASAERSLRERKREREKIEK